VSTLAAAVGAGDGVAPRGHERLAEVTQVIGLCSTPARDLRARELGGVGIKSKSKKPRAVFGVVSKGSNPQETESKRQVVYAKKTLPLGERITAAQALIRKHEKVPDQ
jgi:hypothetical protein